MSRVVIYRETDKKPEEISALLDRYLSQATVSLRPFDGTITYAWNLRKNRVDIQGERFTAEIVLVPKGVVVVAEIPVIWYPFRKRIEGGIARVIDTVISGTNGSDGKEE